MALGVCLDVKVTGNLPGVSELGSSHNKKISGALFLVQNFQATATPVLTRRVLRQGLPSCKHVILGVKHPMLLREWSDEKKKTS